MKENKKIRWVATFIFLLFSIFMIIFGNVFFIDQMRIRYLNEDTPEGCRIACDTISEYSSKKEKIISNDYFFYDKLCVCNIKFKTNYLN